MNSKNKIVLYISIGIMGLSLLFTGIFLGKIFAIFSVTLPKIILLPLQIVFILSAFFNFWLIKYANDKL